MKHSHLLIILLFGSLGQEVLGQAMTLGLWRDGRSTERLYHHSEEPVTWKASDGQTYTVPAGKTSYLAIENGKVKLSTAQAVLARSSSFERVDGGIYNLKSLTPERREEKYDQGLKVKADGNSLRLLGIISDFEGYVAGVIESEAGKEQSLEFYKVQAVICRTYALSNKRRHEHEGFNLCDQVHCQVYKGMSRFNPEILTAAKTTAGEVVVDTNMDLITATFHSNCGGHTVNSEEVWSNALPYLRAKKDTFCLEGNHATWESEILRSAWLGYLEERSGDLSTVSTEELYTIRQPVRSTHLSFADSTVPLKDIRRKWFLNSTYFEMDGEGDKLVLKGKGFGHGVGLCQEGAMNMVNLGYSYQDVLTFYYTDVHLVHLSVIDFFKNN
jgi:stage II sporulation protein D